MVLSEEKQEEIHQLSHDWQHLQKVGSWNIYEDYGEVFHLVKEVRSGHIEAWVTVRPNADNIDWKVHSGDPIGISTKDMRSTTKSAFRGDGTKEIVDIVDYSSQGVGMTVTRQDGYDRQELWIVVGEL